MIASLLVGVTFAIGLHVFYRSLHRTEVRSTPYELAGWEIAPQQVNTAGGTAFAFALFFRATAKVGRGIAKIDSWFSGSSDITSLFGITTFWTQPVLAVVALTAWLLPIAAIITPATLSVTFDYLPPIYESHFVPLPAFASLKFADFNNYNDYGGSGHLTYERASAEAGRIVQAAVAAGPILPITPPAVNASWLVTTRAPRLTCDHVNQTLLSSIKNNIADVLGPFLASIDGSALAEYADLDFPDAELQARLAMFAFSMFGYMSWPGARQDSRGFSQEMPFSLGGETPRINASRPSAAQLASFALEKGLSWRRAEFQDLLFVAVLPRIILRSGLTADEIDGLSSFITAGSRRAMDWAFEEATVLRCKAVASEFTLRFTYDGWSQNQQIETKQAQMQVIQRVSGCPNPDVSLSDHHLSECAIDVETLDRWSNRSMMDLFGDRLIGAANWMGTMVNKDTSAGIYDPVPRAGYSAPSTTFRNDTYRSQILSTSLADSIEVEPWATDAMSIEEDTFPVRALDQVYSLFRTSSKSTPLRSLKNSIEELFFNVTISMASSPSFAYNISAPNAPENVTVTIANMGNIYTYSADKLWLAYGLAIGTTVLSVCLGLLAILRTGASFTLNFSTIVRTVKNAEVSIDTDEEAHPGRDPLPQSWKHATPKIRPSAVREAKSLGSGEYSSVNQSGEEAERPREGDQLHPEDRIDEIRAAPRYSWESARSEEARLSVQCGREDDNIHHGGACGSDELSRASRS
ncbi:hypothetical protein Slin15195_G072360 [Septoria linicola]|uniref:Uncharacterized protein n=1 Tax=Septoria linicola TaxID=215465 RepID=A0A9Q9AQL3_9PEZI|nr:hypothetical protein Slin14017_G105100 [Septoria linicola]USW53917.1 hypothetical protein Slin15195_G072360 [Septoria linicola]